MNTDLLRIIDSICRDKNIDRDELIGDIEVAMAGAVQRNYGEDTEAVVKLDLLSGQFKATVDGQPVDVQVLGRIAAQTAKQMIIQKTRERERVSVFSDFTARRGQIVTGTVTRAEGGNLLVNIGRAEGFLPRSEQIPGETHQAGERLRVLILEVREQPNQVKIILSRSHPELIERLFELEVPEVAERIIEIRALAREAGYRTKVAVTSIDSKVDAVGACVGVRGSRIKNIVEELGGEKIDIVRWNESSQILIQNALKPAEVQEVALCFELGKGTVVVAEDQLSLAIGKRGQNVRLAARLTGWDIDILTPAEYTKHLENVETVLKAVEGVDDVIIDKIAAIGCVSIGDLDEVGPGPLVNELELDAELADRIVEAAGEEVIRQEEQREADAKAKVEQERLAREQGIEPGSAASLVAGTAEVPTPAPTDGAEQPAAPAAAETETPDVETPDADMPGAEAASGDVEQSPATTTPAEPGEPAPPTESAPSSDPTVVAEASTDAEELIAPRSLDAPSAPTTDHPSANEPETESTSAPENPT